MVETKSNFRSLLEIESYYFWSLIETENIWSQAETEMFWSLCETEMYWPQVETDDFGLYLRPSWAWTLFETDMFRSPILVSVRDRYNKFRSLNAFCDKGF